MMSDFLREGGGWVKQNWTRRVSRLAKSGHPIDLVSILEPQKVTQLRILVGLVMHGRIIVP